MTTVLVKAPAHPVVRKVAIFAAAAGAETAKQLTKNTAKIR